MTHFWIQCVCIRATLFNADSTIHLQWRSKEVNNVLGKMFMRDHNTVTLLHH